MQNQFGSATQAKDRHYMHLGNSLARLSRSLSQTTDLCQQLTVNLDSMKVLAANHAAQFITVANQLNSDPPATGDEDDDQSGIANDKR
ncbi:hypothetical protein C8Q75DRAFT_768047 [Abortiporus biennis]|nr:hypothetical protein C8Q75DRAFT_768047 [Abortiporus biennis]